MTSRAETDAWDGHWKSYARTNALNPAQVLRRALVFEALDLPAHRGPVRLLDLGSGTGEFAGEVLVARPDAEVVGLDLSHTGVELAQAKVPKGRFFQQDFSKPMALPESLKGFATHAVCSEVLEHLDDPAAVLHSIAPYLAPGCKVVITVPAGPMSAFDKHIGHRRHFERARLAGLLEGAGLKEVNVRGAGFPFFNLYRLTVVARGEALIKDAAGQDDGKGLPKTAEAAIRAFSALFKLNAKGSDLGWQLVGVAHTPRALVGGRRRWGDLPGRALPSAGRRGGRWAPVFPWGARSPGRTVPANALMSAREARRRPPVGTTQSPSAKPAPPPAGRTRSGRPAPVRAWASATVAGDGPATAPASPRREPSSRPAHPQRRGEAHTRRGEVLRRP